MKKIVAKLVICSLIAPLFCNEAPAQPAARVLNKEVHLKVAHLTVEALYVGFANGFRAEGDVPVCRNIAEILDAQVYIASLFENMDVSQEDLNLIKKNVVAYFYIPAVIVGFQTRLALSEQGRDIPAFIEYINTKRQEFILVLIAWLRSLYESGVQSNEEVAAKIFSDFESHMLSVLTQEVLHEEISQESNITEEVSVEGNETE